MMTVDGRRPAALANLGRWELAASCSIAGCTIGPAPWPPDAMLACIPACNEAERIEPSLVATIGQVDGLLLMVNGSADATAALARKTLAGSAKPWAVLDVQWRGTGGAPAARRLAMDIAADLSPGGMLASLDADTRPLPGWRRDMNRALAAGFDLVCGSIRFDPAEAALLPPADPQTDRLIREFRAFSREIEALLDPDPDNPWPHHGNIGGANFVLRTAAYRALGGLPTPPSGEERALLRLARAQGLRVRFDDGAAVETSCRLEGRAGGGLSDELARTRREADPLVDEALEPASVLVKRIAARTALRQAASTPDRRRHLAALDVAHLPADGPFGPLWLAVEDASPHLRRSRMRLSDLRREMPDLTLRLQCLRAR